MTARAARIATICAAMLRGTAVAAAQGTPPAPVQSESQPQAPGLLPSSIPPVTADERKAAFPDVSVSPVQDNAVHSFVLLDRFEWQQHDGLGGPSWEGRGWIGKDRDRFAFRTEGDTDNGSVHEAEAHLFYSRAVARWWDVLAGIRQDVRPGSPQTWAAIGIEGLAPYWFDVEATGYIGSGGRTQFRFETEYELLLTNRLIVQPLVELNVYGQNDPARKIGAGLATTEFGLRVRFLVKREFAPYIGVTWNQKHFGTAAFATAAGEQTGGARWLVGLRLWR